MRFAWLTLVLWLLPALATAQSAVVLVPEAGVEPAALARARAGAIELLAQRGVRLVPVPDGIPCDAAACAAELAAESGVELAVLVLVEAREDGGSAVRVLAVPADGPPRQATVAVAEGGFGPAAGAALDQALTDGRPGRRGFLMVRSLPPGARVDIDGEPAGTTPLRRMVAAGEHRVRVTPSAGEPRERTVEVTPREEAAVEVDFASADGEEPARAAETPTRTEPSPFNWLLGGGLAIAGIVTLISPLQTIAQDGECVERIENVGCVEQVRFGAQSGVLMGVGLALLVGAVVVDVVAPIRVEVEVGASRGMLRVGGRF